MFAHNQDFCRGVAMVLKGESLKASCYVTHAASLGTLREKMVSNFVRQETPERLRVETGLIRVHNRDLTSRQCDLLVHEPSFEAPLYRWEDFVIVHATAARAVVEVKSELNRANFDVLIENHLSVIKLQLEGGSTFVPTFGYGLNGVTFETFLTYIQESLTKNPLNAADEQKHLNLPVCIAVQSRNYLGIRPLMGRTERPYAFCVADFSRATNESAKPVDGIETGVFLQFYSEMLRSGPYDIDDSLVYDWFNKLPIEAEGKAWVTPDGTITTGNIP